MQTIWNELTDKYAAVSIMPLPEGFGNTLGTMLETALYNIPSIPSDEILTQIIFPFDIENEARKSKDIDMWIHMLELRCRNLKINDSDDTLKENIADLLLEGKKLFAKTNIELPQNICVNQNAADLTLANNNKNMIVLKTQRDHVHEIEYKFFDKNVVYVQKISNSSVNRVDWLVSQTRHQGTMNWDKLDIEIWTDGNMTPKTAFVRACESFVNILETISTQCFAKSK